MRNLPWDETPSLFRFEPVRLPFGSIDTAIPVSRYTQEKRSHYVASLQKAVNIVRRQMRLLQRHP